MVSSRRSLSLDVLASFYLFVWLLPNDNAAFDYQLRASPSQDNLSQNIEHQRLATKRVNATFKQIVNALLQWSTIPESTIPSIL